MELITTRSRSEGDDSQGHSSYTDYTVLGRRCAYNKRNDPEGWYDVSFSRFDFPSSYELRTTHDVVTPNFAKRVASGEIINNDFSTRYVNLQRSPPAAFTRVYTSTHDDGGVWGTIWDGVIPMSDQDLGEFLQASSISSDPVSQLDIDIDVALTNAYANASSSEMQALVSLAEAEKTVASIASISRRAYKILRAAKRLDAKYLAKQLSRNELLDRYMELRYALRPLMYDVRDIVSAVEQSKQYKSTRATSRGFKKGTASHSDSIQLFEDVRIRTIDRKVVYEWDVRAGVLTDVTTSMPSIWGLDQITETVWELTPFSFVIDWFIDVGSKIAAFTPDVGVRQLASWVSVKTTKSCSNVYVGTTINSTSYDTNYEQWSGSRSVIQVDKWRKANPTMSLFPRLNVNLDNYKLLDLVAMFRNLLR